MVSFIHSSLIPKPKITRKIRKIRKTQETQTKHNLYERSHLIQRNATKHEMLEGLALV